MVEKFDYIILNEDNEWLSTGHQQTQEQFEEELAIIQKEQPMATKKKRWSQL